MLGLGLLDELVMVEEVFDRLLLAPELVFEDLDLGLQLDVLFSQLVVQHLHLDGFIIELFFLLALKPVLTCFALQRFGRMRQSGRKTGAHD